MNNDKPLDHEALLNSLDAIDRACEIARRQIQGLFYVVFRVPCINVHQNQLRLQGLKRKRRRHFEKVMIVVMIGQFQNSF